MSSHRIRLAGTLAAVAAGVLVLGACSPNGSDQPVTTSTATVTSTVANQPGDAAGNTGTEQTSPQVTTTTVDTAGVTIPRRPNRDDANVDARDFQVAPDEFTFQSPSGNVWCAIRPSESVPILQFGCQTRKSVPGPGNQTCLNTANNTYAVRIEQSTIHFCTNQGIYSAEKMKVLEYGQTIMVRGDACTSTTDGIACWRGDHGFMISRDVNLTIS